MFNYRSDSKEVLDDLSINIEEVKQNLDEMELLNRWLGSKRLLLHALNRVYNKYHFYFNRKVIIGDLGCGSGDLLRSIDHWSKTKNLAVKLIGIDANPFIIKYAIQKSSLHPEIIYQTIDILSDEIIQSQFDVICINSTCHHFDNDALINLFKKLKSQTRLAIIINDIHRHWFSYFGFKWLAKLLRFSDLTKSDGSLSILRSFQKKELIDILNQANIKDYEIRSAWIFRWEIIIWLKNSTSI